jgi:hypothetical protein
MLATPGTDIAVSVRRSQSSAPEGVVAAEREFSRTR